jgi:hypothetical protein
LGALGLGISGSAQATRPFLEVPTANANEGPGGFAVESWLTSGRTLFGFDMGLEYRFDPVNTVSFASDLTRFKDEGVKVYHREYDAAFQHYFADIPHDGYGFSLRLGTGWDRQEKNSDWGGWVAQTPFSWRNERSATVINVTPGYEKPQHEGGFVTWGIGVEQPLTARDTLFAEFASDSSNDDHSLIHGGWRFWLQPKKVALDLSVGRTQTLNDERNFLTVGVAFFDLH